MSAELLPCPREAIARIIDPGSFVDWGSMTSERIKRRMEALTKADAILSALSSEPGAGGGIEGASRADLSAHACDQAATESGEPSAAEITRAAWAWRNDKDRETDSSDDAYFRNNWQSLPGLRAYVEAQVELGRPLAAALAKTERQP